MAHHLSPEPSGWDRNASGVYLVTLVTRGRKLLLGEVVRGEMSLSAHGRVVADEWERLAAAYPSVGFDAYQVMPNHLHAIVRLAGPRSPARRVRGRRARCPTATLGALIARFKGAVVRRINAAYGTPRASFWEGGYRDILIRNQGELEAVRRYVRENPSQWDEDVENPRRPFDRAPLPW